MRELGPIAINQDPFRVERGHPSGWVSRSCWHWGKVRTGTGVKGKRCPTRAPVRIVERAEPRRGGRILSGVHAEGALRVSSDTPARGGGRVLRCLINRFSRNSAALFGKGKRKEFAYRKNFSVAAGQPLRWHAPPPLDLGRGFTLIELLVVI
jgi:hypothetical protein